MSNSLMLQQIESLPTLIENLQGQFSLLALDLIPFLTFRQIKKIIITGCGDSHHAAVASTLAVQQLTGHPCQAFTAMQFARYESSQIGEANGAHTLVIGISTSGQVSRTIEALAMARSAEATTLALTGNLTSELAQTADIVMDVAIPRLPNEPLDAVLPGTRSFLASFLGVITLALAIGVDNQNLDSKLAQQLTRELGEMPAAMSAAIADNRSLAAILNIEWSEARHFIFCGSGPNYGAAMFCAAKLLEASGDLGLAQDAEEWAHLEYFERSVSTPTFFITASDRDADRVSEVVSAAIAIGRRVAIIAPETSHLFQNDLETKRFPIHGRTSEIFSPMLTTIPGMLFASYRADVMNEPYFRGFGGGRSPEGGGGMSKIRTSHRIDRLPG